MSADAQLPVLLVDDDDDLREAIATSLRLADHPVIEAKNGHEALRAIDKSAIDKAAIGAIVSDIRMPLIDGRQLLQRAHALDADLPVILITGHGDIDQAVESLRNGAYDFIAKPFATDRLIDAVERALDRRRLALENRDLRAEVDAANDRRRLPLIGPSPAIDGLIRAVRQIGSADIDVLIEGEKGTGKAAIAQHLHAAASPSAAALLRIDCDGLHSFPADDRANRHRPGRGRTAAGDSGHGPWSGISAGGTLLLADVDRLSDPAQSALLHFLQSRDIASLPTGTDSAPVRRLRVLSTTSASLSARVDSGAFRSDLYYRLAPVRLDVPPLRARRQDIALLFAHLLQQSALRYRRAVPPLTDAILMRLTSHDWPGNIPELQNFADAVCLNIDTSDRGFALDLRSLTDRVALFEAQVIRSALIGEMGNIAKVCATLALPRKTLYDKMKRHGIVSSDYRKPPAV